MIEEDVQVCKELFEMSITTNRCLAGGKYAAAFQIAKNIHFKIREFLQILNEETNFDEIIQDCATNHAYFFSYFEVSTIEVEIRQGAMLNILTYAGKKINDTELKASKIFGGWEGISAKEKAEYFASHDLLKACSVKYKIAQPTEIKMIGYRVPPDWNQFSKRVAQKMN